MKVWSTLLCFELIVNIQPIWIFLKMAIIPNSFDTLFRIAHIQTQDLKE